MNILAQMRDLGITLGLKQGESAKDWQKRDPKAAAQYAKFITENKAAIVAAFSGLMVKK